MIGIVGINHESASLNIRGQLTFNTEEILFFYELLNNKFKKLEAVLVSTCNRTELYYSTGKEYDKCISAELILFILKFKEISNKEEFNFYNFTGTCAVEHLFRVAAGLNSMIIGENQVLGQLKKAFSLSVEMEMSRSIMNRFFHKAFQAGKKVRSETDINKGASSISYAAVELIRKVYSSLNSHPVLLIGAGEAGNLVLQSLNERGCNKIEIVNRTLSKGESLAERYSAKAIPFEMLETAILNNDIIITSTASEKPIIKKDLLRNIMKKRKNRTQLLIDLSVPGNIDDSIRSMKNIFLFNLDDLQEVVAFNYRKREKSIKEADLIINQLVADFNFWLKSLKLSPTINQLKEKLTGIMENELYHLQEIMPQKEFKNLENFSRKINKKYLGLIIRNLKILSETGKQAECTDLVNTLFDLDISDRESLPEEVKIGE